MRSSKGRNSIYILFFLLIAGWACKDKPGIRPDDYGAMPLYCDYRISGDDESGHVTVLMQFRAGGPDGPGMLLDSLSSVSLNGYTLGADSSRMHGVYYEQRWLASEFNGNQQIEYVNAGGDTLHEKFFYPVFGFRDSFPAKLQVNDFEIEMTGLAPDDSLHILLMDTSYKSTGIDLYIRLVDNKLKISGDDLGRLKKGPVLLDIYRDEEREVNKDSEGGGKLYISFALRRQFVLE